MFPQHKANLASDVMDIYLAFNREMDSLERHIPQSPSVQKKTDQL